MWPRSSPNAYSSAQSATASIGLSVASPGATPVFFNDNVSWATGQGLAFNFETDHRELAVPKAKRFLSRACETEKRFSLRRTERIVCDSIVHNSSIDINEVDRMSVQFVDPPRSVPQNDIGGPRDAS